MPSAGVSYASSKYWFFFTYLQALNDYFITVTYRGMAYYAVVFTPLHILLKLGLLVVNILYLSQADNGILMCGVDGDIVYFTEMMGLGYIGAFSFQMLLAAEQLRIVTYEGTAVA